MDYFSIISIFSFILLKNLASWKLLSITNVRKLTHCLSWLASLSSVTVGETTSHFPFWEGFILTLEIILACSITPSSGLLPKLNNIRPSILFSLRYFTLSWNVSPWSTLDSTCAIYCFSQKNVDTKSGSSVSSYKQQSTRKLIHGQKPGVMKMMCGIRGFYGFYWNLT